MSTTSKFISFVLSLGVPCWVFGFSNYAWMNTESGKRRYVQQVSFTYNYNVRFRLYFWLETVVTELFCFLFVCFFFFYKYTHALTVEWTINFQYGTQFLIVCLAPCKGIRIPESRNFLLLESGILGFGIRNPALRIRNPTKDWNPESNLLKIHSRLNWATRSKEKPSMESLPRVYASTWWHTV